MIRETTTFEVPSFTTAEEMLAWLIDQFSITAEKNGVLVLNDFDLSNLAVELGYFMDNNALNKGQSEQERKLRKNHLIPIYEEQLQPKKFNGYSTAKELADMVLALPQEDYLLHIDAISQIMGKARRLKKELK